MKQIKSSVLLLVFMVSMVSTFTTFAQTLGWNWVNGYTTTPGGAGVSKGLGVDASGNSYQFAIASGPMVFGNTTIRPLNTFLLKHNSTGNLVWAKPQKGYLNIAAQHTDLKGTSLITGTFRDTIIIGNDTLLCKGEFDMFVAKYDSAGNALWARRAGGLGHYPGIPPPIQYEDGGTAVGADSAGNVYVAGYYYGRHSITVEFDSISINYPAAGPTGPYGFLAKYSPSGKIKWVKIVQGITPLNSAQGLALTNKGECYLAGGFGVGFTFGAGGPFLPHQGNGDVWYARYDLNGNLNWARSFGGANTEFCNGIAVNNAGEIYLTGSFQTNTSIGPFLLTGTPQNGTLYLAKFNANGIASWASQTTGSGSIGDAVLTTDRQGNAYVGANYSGQVTIGSQNFSVNSGISTPIISKWSGTGNPLWAISPNGSGFCSGIATDTAATSVYLSGTYDNNLTFGSHILNTSNSGFYLVKLNSQVTGLKELAHSDFSVYPNPARDVLNLNFPEVKGNVLLKLTDVQGKLLLTETMAAGQLSSLVLPKLEAGMYVLTAQTGNRVLTRKVVIQ